MKIINTTYASVLGAIFASSSLQAVTLYTEDFEGFGIASGSVSPNGDILATGGWTVSDNSGNVVNPGPGSATLNPVPAELGTSFFVLQGGGEYSRTIGTIAADTTYTFSLTHFRRDDIAGDAVRLRFFTGTDTAGFLTQDFAAVTTTGTFETREISFNSGLDPSLVGSTFGILFADSTGGLSTPQAGVDNIVVSSIPEPSSALLLGVAGAAFLVRRRK